MPQRRPPLKELTGRFAKLVKRASEFDWLSFSDPQLREACRCYLYGFFRAAVLVAVAGLEARMKALAAVERVDAYDTLVALVFGPAGVYGEDSTRAMLLNDLFQFRNRVAHAGLEPKPEDAALALDLVRETLEALAQKFDGVI